MERKASDVLLEIEQKLDSALSFLKTQEFSLRILANRISEIEKKINSQPLLPPGKIESVGKAPTFPLPISSTIIAEPEMKVDMDTSPGRNGFPRTARAETYEGDVIRPPTKSPHKEEKKEVKLPIQIPRPSGKVEILQPNQVSKNLKISDSFSSMEDDQIKSIPTTQRIVNSNGKSVFMADVEIINAVTTEPISKIRTNGTGKWSASLPIGSYQITIKKHDIAQDLKSIQNIEVTGTKSPFELPVLILK